MDVKEAAVGCSVARVLRRSVWSTCSASQAQPRLKPTLMDPLEIRLGSGSVDQSGARSILSCSTVSDGRLRREVLPVYGLIGLISLLDIVSTLEKKSEKNLPQCPGSR